MRSMRRNDLSIEAPGLLNVTHSDNWDGGLWAICKTRKPFECIMTGVKYPAGADAYRPLGNGMNRMKRLAADSVEKACRN